MTEIVERVAAQGASAEAIRRHYDLSNDFYALWLDPNLVYSCALWHGDEDLQTAQINKLDWHLEHGGARNAGRLLDVGCGWGALLRRAREHYQVQQAVGLSLSNEQIKWIAERPVAGVEARLESWSEHRPSEVYDAAVSIGAFEHFANLCQTPSEKVEGYREFFSFCHRVLKPDGRLSLQTIVYENAERASFSRFFAEKIFPESDLPHLHEIAQSVRGLFEIVLLRNDREHYARTARAWLRNLRLRRREAEQLIGVQRVSDYEKYLGLLVIGFHTGTMNLARLALRRIGKRSSMLDASGSAV